MFFFSLRIFYLNFVFAIADFFLICPFFRVFQILEDFLTLRKVNFVPLLFIFENYGILERST